MPRTPSQNVAFHGGFPNDDPFEPPGRSAAKVILRQLRADGFTAADEDNWRDCGWSIDVELQPAKLQVAISKSNGVNQWFAQIAAISEPGIVATVLGRRFTDCSDDVLSVAQSIDYALRHGGFSGIRWRLDGFPFPEVSTPGPASGTAPPFQPHGRTQ
jgi:hypothetical protein